MTLVDMDVDNKSNKLFAVLIHHLPPNCQREVLNRKEFFPEKYISKVIHETEIGLQIYFTEYQCFFSCICKQKIEVQGITYGIYPLVTNITVCDIGSDASHSDIERWMKNYAPVFNEYPVQTITKFEHFETTSITNDRRVILDVPEVLANFTFSRVELGHRTFQVTFFCRLCRQNGHKQYQCPKYFPLECAARGVSWESITSRRSSLESIPSRRSFENVTSRRSSENVTSRRRSLENVTSPKESYEIEASNRSLISTIGQGKQKHRHVSGDIVVKVKKERGQSIDDGHFLKSKVLEANEVITGSTSLPISTPMWMDHSKFHTWITQEEWRRNLHRVKDESILQKQYFSNGMLSSRYICEDTNKECRKVSQEVGTSGILKNPSSGKPKKKQNFSDILSLLLPPDSDLKYMQKLFQRLINTEPAKVSFTIEKELEEVLSWNEGRDTKKLGNKGKKFLHWLKLYTSSVVKERNTRGSCKSSHHSNKDVQEQDTLGRLKTTGTSHGQPVAQHKRKLVTLSKGIKKTILKTDGVLSPPVLCSFLNQIRSRKRIDNVVAHFTEDIPALIAQLFQVEKVYFVCGKRGNKEEERDISYIRRLRDRLSGLLANDNRNVTSGSPVSGDEEAECFMKQSSSNAIPPVDSHSDLQKRFDRCTEQDDQAGESLPECFFLPNIKTEVE